MRYSTLRAHKTSGAPSLSANTPHAEERRAPLILFVTRNALAADLGRACAEGLPHVALVALTPVLTSYEERAKSFRTVDNCLSNPNSCAQRPAQKKPAQRLATAAAVFYQIFHRPMLTAWDGQTARTDTDQHTSQPPVILICLIH